MSYMELFERVSPSQGLLCIVGIAHNTPAPVKMRYFNKTNAASIKAFINTIDNSGYDVYFACASFKDKEGRRNVKNIQFLRSFFIDIDCGEDKGYTTQDEAVQALRDFCKTTELPKPTVVDSGFGLHVYWSLTEDIEYNTWKPIADAFKQKALDCGLKLDPSVTADGARLLRVPGTKNKKRNKDPRLVKLLSKSNSITLQDFIQKIGYRQINLYADRGMDEVSRRLQESDVIFKFKTIYDKSIKLIPIEERVPTTVANPDGTVITGTSKQKVMRSAGCAQIAYCVAHSATLEEPMWHGALSVAMACIDKIEAVNMVSRGYPGTIPEDWYAKAEKVIPGITCAKWREKDHPELCATCIHRGSINNPLALGVAFEKALPEDNIIEDMHQGLGEVVTIEAPAEYPFPWVRPKHGGVVRKGASSATSDDDGDTDEILVCANDLWVKQRIRDGEQDYAVIVSRLPKDGIVEFTVPNKELVTAKSLAEVLSKKGVMDVTNNKKMKWIVQYISDWVVLLQKKAAADVARGQFGWCEKDTRFIMGNREIDAQGEVHYNAVAPGMENLMDIYTSKGTLEAWKRVANTYARPGNEARAFSLFASFGAPLYKFIGEGSMLIHLTNTSSGVGKSTAQKLATSAWGHPVKGLLLHSDTPKFKLRRSGMLNNIPVCIDEITNIDPKELSTFAFDLASGRDRNRLLSNIEERVNNATWATIFQTSGNNSLYDALKQHNASVEGEMYRILEIPIDIDTTLTKQQADELFTNSLLNNYGLAGELYMRYVVPNKDNVLDLLRETQKEFDNAAEMISPERFYSACMACVFTGAKIANSLGLIDIPIEPVWNWAQRLLYYTRNTIKRASVLNGTSPYTQIINKFWNVHHQHIIKVNAGVTQVDANLLNGETLKPIIGEIMGRDDVRAKRLYIARTALDNYLQRTSRISMLACLKGMEKEGIRLPDQHINLGSQTGRYGTGSVDCYVFDTVKLSLDSANPSTV